MKRLLTSVFLLCASAFAGTCGNGYAKSRQFVVPFGLVPNTDQTSFPVTLTFNGASSFGSVILTDLKTVANGGQIQNTANNSISVSGPADLIFCDAASAGNALKFEVASYSATTGAMEAYVKIPTLSHTTNNSYWMFYGNAAVVTSQQDLSLWADASFLQVCHLPDGSSLNVSCSVSGFTQTNHSATAISGAIDGAGNFVAASTQWTDTGSPYNSTTAATLEAWVNPASASLSDAPIVENESYGIRVGGDAPTLKPYMFACNGTCGIIGPNSPITQSIWSYFAGTFSPSTITTYVNGVSSSGRAYVTPAPASITSSPGNFRIGNRVSGSVQFNGGIDEVRISNSTRSADWITTTYNDQSAPSGFSMMLDNTVNASPHVVQTQVCRGVSPLVCTFPQNVTSGHYGFIAFNGSNDDCTVGTFADTLGSTFTVLASSADLGLGGSGSCVVKFPITSSGADSVTITRVTNIMGAVLYEVAGVASPLLDGASGTFTTPAATFTINGVTATTSNTMLFCVSGVAPNNSGPAQNFSPSTTAANDINNFNVSNGFGGAAILQFTGSGAKSCTFTYGVAPNHIAGTIAAIKYNPVAGSRRRMSQIY